MGKCKLINAEGEENNNRTQLWFYKKKKIQSCIAKSGLLEIEISQ